MSPCSELARVTFMAPMCAFVVAMGGCASLIALDELKKVDCAGDCNDAGGQPAAPSDDAGSNAGCPGTGGPSGVAVPLPEGGTFCIDSTEVTNAEYAAFLTAWPQRFDVPEACRNKNDHTPSAGWPYDASRANMPVAYVDWCDAWAFCAWSGKQLCGVAPGAPSDTPPDDVQSRWYVACAGPSSTSFPYGGSYQPGVCNDQSDAAVPANAPASCMGGFAGLLDMSGNLAEWDAWCQSTRSGDQCIARGGSYACSMPSRDCACAAYAILGMLDTYPDVGIRCCSP